MAGRRQDAGGVTFIVRLTPKAARESIDGPVQLADGRTVLGVRVRAVAEKGKANAALEGVLAEALGLARRSVAVVGGTTARLKTVRADGDPAELGAALARLGLPKGGIKEGETE